MSDHPPSAKALLWIRANYGVTMLFVALLSGTVTLLVSATAWVITDQLGTKDIAHRVGVLESNDVDIDRRFNAVTQQMADLDKAAAVTARTLDMIIYRASREPLAVSVAPEHKR